MSYTLATMLAILWLLGVANNCTFGGFIHVLLAVAVFMVLSRFISTRKQI